MAYIMFFVIATVALIATFIAYSKKAVVRRMDQAVQMVKIGLFGRLRSSYLSGLGDHESTMLAAAVANYIFSEEPTKPEAVQFQKENSRRIGIEA